VGWRTPRCEGTKKERDGLKDEKIRMEEKNEKKLHMDWTGIELVPISQNMR
jgi:hypothetical protein